MNSYNANVVIVEGECERKNGCNFGFGKCFMNALLAIDSYRKLIGTDLDVDIKGALKVIGATVHILGVLNEYSIQ
jgi:hypothetical protein